MGAVSCMLLGLVAATGAALADYPWRVPVLDSSTADVGLFRGASCLFTIPGYFDYGYFEPREHCELPGKLFRARAGGSGGPPHTYYAPAFWGEPITYHMEGQPLYAAWQVKAPEACVPGGRYSLVCPSPGPWRVWCGREGAGPLLWHIEVLRDGRWTEVRVPARPDGEGQLRMQVVMEPRAIRLQAEGRDLARCEHDAHAESFRMTLGSGQTLDGGDEVVSEYREVYFHDAPYPYRTELIPDGPEDLRPEDDAIVCMVNSATPDQPRHSEGDLIELKDNSLLLAWTQYCTAKGWDESPARIAARVSRDRGRTWDEPRVLVAAGAGTNVMSVSLGRAGNGDLLLCYGDRMPGSNTMGMVLRRSADEGQTWGASIWITPRNGNAHAANNACLRRLSSGRLLLSCREYVDKVRWPYCLYSDDDGRTWQANTCPIPASPTGRSRART